MASDLHERLRAETERRLEVARAATPGPWEVSDREIVRRSVLAAAAQGGVVVPSIGAMHNWPTPLDSIHIALHDPADAIRRYESALRVLNRHRPCDGAHIVPLCAGCDHRHDIDDCPELLDLAASLGVEVTDGQ